VKLCDKAAYVELRERLGLVETVAVLHCNILLWYRQKDGSEWVKKCMDFAVEGARSRVSK